MTVTDNTTEAIEAAARAILLAETEDDMGLLCDQLTEWEAYHAARAAAPALMEAGARLALQAAAKLVGFNNFYRGAVNPYDNSLYTTLKSIESAISTMDPAAIIKEAKK